MRLFIRKDQIWFSLNLLKVIEFCFRLNIFTSNISDLLLPLGAEGAVNLGILFVITSSLL